MTIKLYTRTLIFVVTLFSVGVFANVAEASHAWGIYHWARTVNPFTVKLGDAVGSMWDSYLVTTSNDWNLSSVLDTVIVPTTADPRKCRAVQGRIQVCNSKYGNNGWLGVASIWTIGGHIAQSTVKLNDTYFNTAKYNTPAWKNLVMCQEVGHGFGLGHQDEVFTNPNLGTCMDYTNDPTPNQHPNQHDYDQLGIMYGHLDTTTTLSQSTASAAQLRTNDDEDDDADHEKWGKETKRDGSGRTSHHERDLGGGKKVHTFVVWAE